MLKSAGYETEIVNATGDDALPDPVSYNAVIILGGPMSVYDRTPAIQSQINLIKQAIEHEVPTLGVCLGSQLIAQAAGGRVFKGTKKEIGWGRIQATEAGKQGLLRGLEDPLWTFQWHGDTYDLPPSATLLAYSELYPQAFQVGSALGVQFHVEVDPGMIRSWIAEYEAEVASESLIPETIIGDRHMFEKIARVRASVLNYFLSLVK